MRVHECVCVCVCVCVSVYVWPLRDFVANNRAPLLLSKQASTSGDEVGCFDSDFPRAEAIHHAEPRPADLDLGLLPVLDPRDTPFAPLAVPLPMTARPVFLAFQRTALVLPVLALLFTVWCVLGWWVVRLVGWWAVRLVGC